MNKWKSNKRVWLFVTGVLVAGGIVFSAVAVYLSLRPYYIVWRSYQACLHLADPHQTGDFRAAKGLLALQVQLPKKKNLYRLAARFSYLKPDLLRFHIRGSLGKVSCVYHKDIWLYPAQGTVLLFRPGLPRWKVEGKGSPVASVRVPRSISARVSASVSAPLGIWVDRHKFSMFVAVPMLRREVKVKMYGMESVDGVACYVLELRLRRSLREKFNGSVTLWIGRKDYLPRKVQVADASEQWRAVATMKQLELNPHLQASDFVFVTPPRTQTQDIPMKQLKRFLCALPRLVREFGISNMIKYVF
ncbi:MAG: DUF2092 domain-containing protein [Planctomycetes bacterium]|jgi:outer membrane lipoprotein-sorting protein|nr:DUF2092 domain-containing protein [Planctomycetota bacterium]